MPDGDHPGTELPRHRGGAVRGSVVHDDDFERLPQRPSRTFKRVQRAAEQQLLVVGGDDEGDHASPAPPHDSTRASGCGSMVESLDHHGTVEATIIIVRAYGTDLAVF